jgi:hypothetical protein
MLAPTETAKLTSDISVIDVVLIVDTVLPVLGNSLIEV